MRDSSRLRMFDHVTIRVADRRASERFFDTVLTPLGVEDTSSTRSFATWEELIVTAADGMSLPTTGLRLAFTAPSREQVDAFWQAGVDAGHPGDAPPAERDGGTYTALLGDPDGNAVEAVHHDPARRREGIIEHLEIHVADVPAAAAFYSAIAPAAGLVLRDAQPDRATVGHVRSDRWFALVPGEPTQDLHIAFPGDDDAVRRFHRDAIAAGYRSNGEPGERRRYHPGYYSAYVLDPDGTNVEVVDHHR